MSSPAQFAMKMAKIAGSTKTAQRGVVNRMAQTVKVSVQARLAVAAPSGTLNAGRRGKARIGVTYHMPDLNKAVVRMTGPAHLIERGTKPHRIPRERKQTRRTRGQTAKRLAIPGIGIRMSAMHPGTQGKHPWEKGVTSALPLLDDVAGKYYFDAIRKAMR